MMYKKLLVAALFAASIGSAAAQVVVAPDVYILTPVPPPQRIEILPEPRTGSAWIPGYWDYRDNRYSWVEGNWQAERQGYVYEEPKWQQEADGRWRRDAGRWTPR